MSDKRSPAIFIEVFNWIEEALEHDSPNREAAVTVLANRMWALSGDYDFHPCELEMDDLLIKLGFARRCEPEDKFDHDVEYKGVDYK